MTIVPPTADPSRSALRAIVEGLAQYHFLSAFAVSVFRFTHPSEIDRIRETWEAAVSDAVNDHERRLAAVEYIFKTHLTVSPLALEIGRLIAEESTDGLNWPLVISELIARFPSEDPGEVEEAIYELVHIGLLGEGTDGIVVTIEFELFTTFDPSTKGFATLDDAKAVAREMLIDEEMTWIPNLDRKLAWERRRLNPAVGYLMRFFPDGRCSKEVQANYPTMGFFPTGAERFALRQFAGS